MQRTEQREAHGVRHRMKELSGGPVQRINRQVARDDDGDRIENGAVHVSRRGENDIGEFVILAGAKAEFAIDVLDHDDGAVNDDAEIDGADGEKIGGFSGPVQENEREEKGQRNRQSGDRRPRGN